MFTSNNKATHWKASHLISKFFEMFERKSFHTLNPFDNSQKYILILKLLSQQHFTHWISPSPSKLTLYNKKVRKLVVYNKNIDTDIFNCENIKMVCIPANRKTYINAEIGKRPDVRGKGKPEPLSPYGADCQLYIKKLNTIKTRN